MSIEHSPSKSELEAEIHELRRSVGDTVEALSYKFDVKARAKDRARALPASVPVLAASVVLVGVGVWLWRRRS
ncbi:DUF3618 domain-containing protein [Nocardioides pelophilus]|uniref:DUF3618 domain-containing protein n=1 Tax=Nocardioides pelophilus TaxID=2172019 RepID=UPI00160362A2|nr:DUF3618 domain-containing protein [Nocardioides pelophilus]